MSVNRELTKYIHKKHGVWWMQPLEDMGCILQCIKMIFETEFWKTD